MNIFRELPPEDYRYIYFDYCPKNGKQKTFGEEMQLGRYLTDGLVVLPDMGVVDISLPTGSYYWCYANVKVDQPAILKHK